MFWIFIPILWDRVNDVLRQSGGAGVGRWAWPWQAPQRGMCFSHNSSNDPLISGDLVTAFPSDTLYCQPTQPFLLLLGAPCWVVRHSHSWWMNWLLLLRWRSTYLTSPGILFGEWSTASLALSPQLTGPSTSCTHKSINTSFFPNATSFCQIIMGVFYFPSSFQKHLIIFKAIQVFPLPLPSDFSLSISLHCH